MNNRHWIVRCQAIVILFGLVAQLGCSDGRPATYPVKGKVIYQGQPLSNVSVTFYPATGRPASGRTDAAGEFTLTTFEAGDGATPGENTVTVTPVSTAAQTENYDYSAAAADSGPKYPDKYKDKATSDLKVTVTEGTNDIPPLELK